jgi:trehalose 6-phosphate synthase
MDNGDFESKRGTGGLVTALGALAEQLDVLWIASALSDDDEAWAEEQGGEVRNVEGINLRLIINGDDEYDQFYSTIANPLLWFIQHQLWDTMRNPVIDKTIWEAWEEGYTAINKRFAEIIADSIDKVLADDPDRPVIIFPQDYHLYLVPKFLRDKVGDDAFIQPFVHIPWPGPDGWRLLPKEMRTVLVESLLHSDSIGFQTRRDAFNFVQTARLYIDGAHSRGRRDAVEYHGRWVGARNYPISIDVEKVEGLVNEGQARLHKEQIGGQVGDRKLILRVDRVEPSKNILRGLQAYRQMLDEHPEHQGDVTMLALLVPSRMAVDEYQTYLRDIMAEAGMINATYSDEFWQPVTIVLGDNYPRALAAMQLYDVLLVNPINDGMNLVAKEGALVNNKDGMIVLSEQAGAYEELGQHAISISPFDVYSTSEAMHKALTMPENDRRERAKALEDKVRGSDVRRWFYNQLQDAINLMTGNASIANDNANVDEDDYEANEAPDAPVEEAPETE